MSDDTPHAPEPPPGEESRNRLLRLIRPFWSQARTIQALGLKNSGVLQLAVEDCKILGLRGTGDTEWVFPVWQFHRNDGVATVRPGLLPVLDVLGDHDPWAVAVWLRTESPEIGCTALDLATREPGSEALLQLARRVRHEWSDGRPDENQTVRHILTGRASYDDADRATQAQVRQAWDRRAEVLRSALDLAAEFEQQGRAWSEIGEEGEVVRRGPRPDDGLERDL